MIRWREYGRNESEEKFIQVFDVKKMEERKQLKDIEVV
jgi:hypothetical protein